MMHIVTPQEPIILNNRKFGEQMRGLGTVKRTTVRRPSRCSHPASVVDHCANHGPWSH